MEIRIVGSDGYVFDIDEVSSIVIKNTLGDSFNFEPQEMESIKIIQP